MRMITPYLDKILTLRMLILLKVSKSITVNKATHNLIDQKQTPSKNISAVKLVKTKPLKRKSVACYSEKEGNN